MPFSVPLCSTVEENVKPLCSTVEETAKKLYQKVEKVTKKADQKDDKDLENDAKNGSEPSNSNDSSSNSSNSDIDNLVGQPGILKRTVLESQPVLKKSIDELKVLFGPVVGEVRLRINLNIMNQAANGLLKMSYNFMS